MTTTRPRYRPSLDETLLHCAYAWSARGTCPSAQVGCVLARDGRSLVSGYNGAPAGMDHCTHEPRISTAGGDPFAETCRTAVHDVANAIAFAARHGVATEGATAYCTLSPCTACAKLLIQAGIVRVVVGEFYRDPSGVELLLEADIPTERLQP